MTTSASKNKRLKYYSVLVIFCMIYWVIDSLWSFVSFEQNLRALMFSEPASLLDTLMLRVSPYQMVSRLIVIGLFAVADTILFEVIISKHRTEAALRDSEAMYSTLVNHAGEAIFVAQDLIVKFANPKTAEFTGIDMKSLVGEPTLQFVHPEDLSTMKRFAEQQGSPSSRTSKCAFRMISKQKQTLWVHINSTPITWENKHATLNFLHDISEETRLAEQLRRSERMETIGMMAGGVAHDLNNILTGLVSYPDLLLMDIPENNALRKPLLTMKRSGKRAALIVQDLLTLARRNVPGMDVVQLNTVIRDYLDSPECIELTSCYPGITIENRPAPDLLNIRGSAVHLSKTVMNLVSNAAEACGDSGTIIISTANQYVDQVVTGYEEIQEGNYAVLKVYDSGRGISPEDIVHIFEPFYSKKVMGRSGTGLGMAVVWGTVKDHNGYIDLKSTPGSGTEVTLYFPVTRDAVIRQAKHDTLELKGNGERILIIDDVKEQQEVGILMLTRLGYQPYAASTGEQALREFKNNPADLVILDMIMPGSMGGLDIYKEIIKINPGQKTLITSGFSQTERVREMQRLGAGRYLRKPYTMADIGQAIKFALSC